MIAPDRSQGRAFAWVGMRGGRAHGADLAQLDSSRYEKTTTAFFPARLTYGNPIVHGSVGGREVLPYLRRKLPRIFNCYEKALAVDPSLAGAIVFEFTITKQGDLDMGTTSGPHYRSMKACTKTALKTIHVKPGWGVVEVRLPMLFERMFQGDVVEVAPSQPRAPSLLAGREKDLVQCFRRQNGRRYGAAVVDLSLDQNGHAQDVSVRGWGQSSVDQCIASAAAKGVRGTPRGRHSCPVVFGPLPKDRLPGIDVAAQVRLTPHVGAEPVQVGSTDTYTNSAGWYVPGLYKLLSELGRARQWQPQDAPITITGPFVMRVDESVPARVVLKLLNTLDLSNWSALLMARADDGWRFLPRRGIADIENLPVAPIPMGTGATWSSRWFGSEWEWLKPGPARGSILVTEGGVTVANTQGLLREADWNAMPAVVADLRRSLPSTQTSVEIATGNDVNFGQVTRLIDAAAGVGFDTWRLVEAGALSSPMGSATTAK